MKDDVLQAVIAGAKANGSWDARYGEVSIKEARSQTKGEEHMKEEWLFRGALVPIDAATTAALVAEIKRLIDVVGGMALAQPEQDIEYCTDYHCAGDCGQPHNQKEMQEFFVPQPEQGPLAKVEPCAVCGEGNARLLVLRSCDTCHSEYAGQAEMKVALGKPEQEPVAYFDWLPKGATHIGRIKVKTKSGGRLEMGAYAFKYAANEMLMVYTTDNDNEYPGWREAKQCFYHLNFPVFPIPTTPPKQEPHNFCPRCGKRLIGMAFAAGGVHTCTPPEGGHQ